MPRAGRRHVTACSIGQRHYKDQGLFTAAGNDSIDSTGIRKLSYGRPPNQRGRVTLEGRQEGRAGTSANRNKQLVHFWVNLQTSWCIGLHPRMCCVVASSLAALDLLMATAPERLTDVQIKENLRGAAAALSPLARNTKEITAILSSSKRGKKTKTPLFIGN